MHLLETVIQRVERGRVEKQRWLLWLRLILLLDAGDVPIQIHPHHVVQIGYGARLLAVLVAQYSLVFHFHDAVIFIFLLTNPVFVIAGKLRTIHT